MSRRLVIAAVAAVAVAGAVVPSFATTGPSLPVGVHIDHSNGVSFSTWAGSQPLFSGSVDNNGRVCGDFSYEVPQCVAIVSPNRQKLPEVPIVVRQDDSGTTIGAGEVGVHISPNGRICPLVSTQTWQCVGGEG